MPPRTDMQLVIDLETSGSEVETCEIIEIGAVLLSMTQMESGYPKSETIATFQTVVAPSPRCVVQIMENPVVKSMHTKNGLLASLQSKREWPTIREADEQLVAWLKPHLAGRTDHVPLGGSGAAHFDRKFIAKYMPLLDKRISYWAYDCGVLRRTFELLGLPTHGREEDKTHRALEDALFHTAEWRYYTSHIADTWRVYNIHAEEESEADIAAFEHFVGKP